MYFLNLIKQIKDRMPRYCQMSISIMWHLHIHLGEGCSPYPLFSGYLKTNYGVLQDGQKR